MNADEILNINLFYPLLFLIIAIICFGIYHIILTVLSNNNEKDTKTKFQLMFEKSSDNQKELQYDTTDKLVYLADNVVKLNYTQAEARETHEIQKTLKELENRISKLEQRT